MPASDKNRIIFLDMMRALAVLMMVEGHTVDAFLNDSFRNFNSISFNVWLGIRGFTAPIFMFTSGVVFTYLLRLNKETFFKNPRVRKGFLRFVTLVVIAYLLRYPTYTFFDFSTVTREQWMTFFTVDALHLIGIGILFILIFALIGEILITDDWKVFLFGALVFFIAYIFTENIPWTSFLPLPIAAYFYHGTGSYFPIFPWTGYVLSGAILGSILAHNPGLFNSKKFSMRLLTLGMGLTAFALVVEFYDVVLAHQKTFFSDNLYLISLRLGGVIMLNALMSFIALKIKDVPNIIKQVGRHTLSVYAVHVIIIYGSAWIPGFNILFHKKMNVLEASIAAVIMIALMIAMVMLIEKYKLYKRSKLVSVSL